MCSKGYLDRTRAFVQHAEPSKSETNGNPPEKLNLVLLSLLAYMWHLCDHNPPFSEYKRTLMPVG